MRFCPTCHERYDDAAQFCPHDGQPLPVDEADRRIGTVLLGQFELLEVIGKGAMGTVYRAWQTGMERQVAIKILRPELIRDPGVVARFDREARAVAKLSHPNIVTSFLVGETDDGLPFLAMEHVEGESLAEVIDRERALETGRALRIALQITSALTEAHAEGIVHRDLKPANILLTQRRRMPDFVKVLDFGIAKILRGESESRTDVESRLTREGTIFGTPHYIAPEQAAGSEVDHRADLYGLGCILYRMLTGRLPFEGAGIAVLLAQIGQPAPRPSEIVPGFDPRIEAVIEKAMAKQPADRFQSAEEMGDALETLGARGAATEPASDVSPPRLPVVTHDLEVDVALISAERPPSQRSVAPAGLSPASQSRAAGERIDPSPPRRRGGPWLGILGVLLAGGGAAAAVVAFEHRQPVPPPVAAAQPMPAPEPPEPLATQDKAVPELARPSPALRTVTVGEGGFAIRAEVPRDPRIGVAYAIHFDIFGPSGAPLAVPTIEASFEDPDNDKETVTAPAVRGAPGRYTLERRFASAGRHHVHLFPAPAQPELHIWFDLLVADADGKLPAAPVVRRPRSKPRSPLAASGMQMIAPEPPPAPVTEPAGGDGASDPYHDDRVDDEPLKPPAPLPSMHRPKKPTKPNPDGLE